MAAHIARQTMHVNRLYDAVSIVQTAISDQNMSRIVEMLLCMYMSFSVYLLRATYIAIMLTALTL